MLVKHLFVSLSQIKYRGAYKSFSEYFKYHVQTGKIQHQALLK